MVVGFENSRGAFGVYQSLIKYDISLGELVERYKGEFEVGESGGRG